VKAVLKELLIKGRPERFLRRYVSTTWAEKMAEKYF